jgi:RNA polymerase sigma factor (sigma-70 family)
MQDTYSQLTQLIPAMRRYARSMLKDSLAADDVVQDSLEKAIANWHRRRSDDPRSWVFAILHNLSVNHLTKAGRRGAIASSDAMPDHLHASNPTQESELYSRDVLEAVANLPAVSRSVLLLVVVEERSYAEAAKILKVPVETVMSRLSRARDQLRLLLGDAPAHISRQQRGHPYTRV